MIDSVICNINFLWLFLARYYWLHARLRKLRFWLLWLLRLLTQDLLWDNNHFSSFLNLYWLCNLRYFKDLWWFLLSLFSYLHSLHYLLNYLFRYLVDLYWAIYWCLKLNLLWWFFISFFLFFSSLFFLFRNPTWRKTLIDQVLGNFNWCVFFFYLTRVKLKRGIYCRIVLFLRRFGDINYLLIAWLRLYFEFFLNLKILLHTWHLWLNYCVLRDNWLCNYWRPKLCAGTSSRFDSLARSTSTWKTRRFCRNLDCRSS